MGKIPKTALALIGAFLIGSRAMGSLIDPADISQVFADPIPEAFAIQDQPIRPPLPPSTAPPFTPPRTPAARPLTTAPRATTSVPATTPPATTRPGLESALLATPALPPFENQRSSFGSLAGFTVGGIPQMIGDLGPTSTIRIFQGGIPPLPTPFPPRKPPRVPQPARAAAFIPTIRGIKISENQSPRPQDRVYFTFNYFQSVNDPVNRELHSPVGYTQVFRYIWGFEKTFLDGQGSIGIRVPQNTVTATQTVSRSFGNFGGTSTAVGDLSLILKYILLEDKKSGSLVSGGLAVSAPTGPGKFAGAPGFASITHTTTFQPYLGFIWNFDRLYLHGFTAIDVPANSKDVTLLYNDLGIGYFLRRDEPGQEPRRWIRSIAPTFEVHVNDPLNHRGPFHSGDPVAMRDIVNLTYGINFGIGRRTNFTLGTVTPVTGPRPFSFETMAFLNIMYGKSSRAATTPPVLGGY